MELVSVDPGLRGCGIAHWRGTNLVLAKYVVNPHGSVWYEMVTAVEVVVGPVMYIHHLAIEMPQAYIHRKGDQNDLLTLAGLVGAFTYFFSRCGGHFTLYRPAEWKGQVPKEITEKRARARLSTEELKRIKLPSASLRHNVWDAIGIGLHHLSRAPT